MISKCFVIIALLFAVFVNANIVPATKNDSGSNFGIMRCIRSKTYVDNYEPAIFNASNNLLNDYENIPTLCSDQIVIRGRILDENCNPITDAKVQIWQAGCDGKYPYVPLKNKINHKIINLNPESSFVGSGTAVTNNLGEFSFITMLPVNQSFNYINARVMAKNFQTTQTKWFVDNKLAKKLYDREFKGDNNYYFDIIIPKLKN